MTIDAGASGSPATTEADVVALYQKYLGRVPEDYGAIAGRLGLPLWLVDAEISASGEAANRRAALAAMVGPVGPQGPDAKITGGGSGPIQIPALPGPAGIGAEVANWILRALQPVADKLNAISGGQLGGIKSQLDEVGKAVAAAKGQIDEQFANALVELAHGSLALVDVGIRQMRATLEGFVANAADVADVAGAFTSAIGEKKDEIGAFVLEHVGAAFTGGLSGFFEALEGEAPEVFTVLPQKILASPAVTPEIRAILEPMLARTRPANFILGLVVGSLSLGSISNAIMGPTIELIRQTANDAEPVEIPAVYQIAQADAQGIIPSGGAEQLARRLGYEPVPYRMMRELARNWLPHQEVTAAWLRGEIDDAEADRQLTRYGYDESSRKVIKSLAFVVATPQDVIRLAVRDVYQEDRRRELGLDENFPERVLVEARKAGVPEQLIRDLWAAHWENPSLDQVFEMVHRRVKKPDGSVFGVEDLRRFMVTADVAPWARGLLEQITYTPLRLVDIRAARKSDVLSYDEMRALLGERGYSERDAGIAADLFEASVKGEKKRDLADLTDGLRTRIVSAVIAGTLTEARGRTYLASLGYDDEEISAFVAEADEIRAGARASRMRELVEQLVVKSKWTVEEGIAELRRRGYTDAELTQIREELELERKLRAPSADVEEGRDLTKAEILDAMSARILTRDEAESMLAELRYDTDEIATLVRLEQYREAKAAQTESIAVIRAQRVAGRIDDRKATEQLDQLGIPSAQRDRLLQKWDLELAGKGADLSAAQIGELLKRRLMPDDEARAYLERLGYDERERTLLMALWGSQAAESEARVQTAASKAEAAARARTEAEERRRQAAADAAAKRQRDLNTGQLVAAYRRGVIREEELRSALLGLGYDANEAATIIATEKAKGAAR